MTRCGTGTAAPDPATPGTPGHGKQRYTDGVLTVRAARPDDRPFVVATAQRLSAFGPPPWRTADEVVAGELRTIEAFFRTPEAATALLVAESAQGERLGFIYLQELQDYFTLEKHGHVGIIAVAEAFEGRGAGKALMDAAERWAVACGYAKLTLSVFEHNQRARRVYEHCGFAPDTIRYLKVLQPH